MIVKREYFNLVCAAIAARILYPFIRFAWQNLKIRRELKRLHNTDEVGFRFGVEAERLTAFAEEQGIRPRYNINGKDFYAMEDFGDAAVLLRASVAPLAGPETLLRPAIGTQTPAETLLRPSSGITQSAPQTASQATPIIAPPAQPETQSLTTG